MKVLHVSANCDMNSKIDIRLSKMRTTFMINLQSVKNGKSFSDFMRLCCNFIFISNEVVKGYWETLKCDKLVR